MQSNCYVNIMITTRTPFHICERNKTFIFTFLYKHPTPIRTNRSAHVLKAIKNRHVLGKVSVVKHHYVKLN